MFRLIQPRERETRMKLEELIEHLKKIEEVPDEFWINSLDERKRRELEFHDQHRDRSLTEEKLDQDTYEKLYGNRKFYAATALSNSYLDDWIRVHSKDKVLLDYACGDGSTAIKAAKAGAKLAIGLDISAQSIENAKRDALKAGVEANTYFVQADAENTKLPDNCIDSVVCSGMLHHLDLSFAFPELRRVLVPGGKLLAMEALDYNPIIKLYRMMTPAMRTDWEKAHILDMSDIRFAKRFFDVGEVKFWHIASIFSPYLPKMLPLLNGIDAVLTKTPLLKYLAWIFTFELIKPKN
jgi:SAM-dependent methyltransferase